MDCSGDAEGLAGAGSTADGVSACDGSAKMVTVDRTPPVAVLGITSESHDELGWLSPGLDSAGRTVIVAGWVEVG